MRLIDITSDGNLYQHPEDLDISHILTDTSKDSYIYTDGNYIELRFSDKCFIEICYEGDYFVGYRRYNNLRKVHAVNIPKVCRVVGKNCKIYYLRIFKSMGEYLMINLINSSKVCLDRIAPAIAYKFVIGR